MFSYRISDKYSQGDSTQLIMCKKTDCSMLQCLPQWCNNDSWISGYFLVPWEKKQTVLHKYYIVFNMILFTLMMKNKGQAGIVASKTFSSLPLRFSNRLITWWTWIVGWKLLLKIQFRIPQDHCWKCTTADVHPCTTSNNLKVNEAVACCLFASGRNRLKQMCTSFPS